MGNNESSDVSANCDASLSAASTSKTMTDSFDRQFMRYVETMRGDEIATMSELKPSCQMYDRNSPKLQPFPSAKLPTARTRSHSESSVFRHRVKESKKSNGERSSWLINNKIRFDQLFKWTLKKKRKSKVDCEALQVQTNPIINCETCRNGETTDEWKVKLEKWADSLRQAIEVINREEKMRAFIDDLQKENYDLKSQLVELVTSCNEWKMKSGAKEIFERNVDQNESPEMHVFCHSCEDNNHFEPRNKSLCHLLDLDSLVGELNTILTCDKCCTTCRIITCQLFRCFSNYVDQHQI